MCGRGRGAYSRSMGHRLFVALDLPDEVRRALYALGGGLRGARRSPPENLHITLRFIGEVDRRQANDIAAELAGLRSPRFAVRLAGAGAFGAGRRVRSLWAGVTPSPELSLLKRRVDATCARAGLAPDDRRFTPHVTLARLSGGGGRAAAQRAGEIAGLVAGGFDVEEAVLFESRLGADGPRYERVARYPLEAR